MKKKFFSKNALENIVCKMAMIQQACVCECDALSGIVPGDKKVKPQFVYEP